MTKPSTQPEKTLYELIKDIRFAMFTTRAGNGRLRTRPMTTQYGGAKGDDATSSLWFFMSRSGDPVDELKTEPQVNLAYADTDKDVYVSVSGTARVVDDRPVRQRLWSKMNEAWFPKGVDDPDLALVCVEPLEAEYWNVKESKVRQVATMLKAAVTGEPPTGMGDHQKIGDA